MNENNNNKKIIFNETCKVGISSKKRSPILDSVNSSHRQLKTDKERSKRIITEKKIWSFTKEELEYENQLVILSELKKSVEKSPTEDDSVAIPSSPNKIQRMVFSQIKSKLRSYKEQDMKKNKYDPTRFITIDFILWKLKETAMICFYCKDKTNLLYEFVREPKQWTVERLDNAFGHNCDNIEIACLSCNLRRRTTYFERYLTTKSICAGIIKLNSDFENNSPSPPSPHSLSSNIRQISQV